MSEFTLYKDTVYEATRKESIEDVISQLCDNNVRKITPKDVRDNVLSLYSEMAFKPIISPDGTQYIGMDTLNPEESNYNMKIVLGNSKNSSGDYIVDSSMLNSDTDIYFSSTINSDKTKISLLYGDDYTKYQNAPYIQSDANELKFSNEQNDITLKSNSIKINNMSLDTSTPNDGDVVMYKDSKLIFCTTSQVPVTVIGSAGSTLNLEGDVLYNGYPLDFSDERDVLYDVGGVSINDKDIFRAGSFVDDDKGISGVNWPIVEVLKKILYGIRQVSSTLIVSRKLSDNTIERPTKYLSLADNSMIADAIIDNQTNNVSYEIHIDDGTGEDILWKKGDVKGSPKLESTTVVATQSLTQGNKYYDTKFVSKVINNPFCTVSLSIYSEEDKVTPIIVQSTQVMFSQIIYVGISTNQYGNMALNQMISYVYDGSGEIEVEFPNTNNRFLYLVIKISNGIFNSTPIETIYHPGEYGWKLYGGDISTDDTFQLVDISKENISSCRTYVSKSKIRIEKNPTPSPYKFKIVF